MRLIIVCFLFVLSSCGLFANTFLSNEDIETFYKQGYVIKKGGLDPDILRKMDERSLEVLDVILNVLSREDYSYSSDIQKTYIEGTQIVFQKEEGKDPSILRMVGCSGIEPEFLSVLRSDKMVQSFFALLDSDQLEHLICQFHPKLPFDGVQFYKHKDIFHRKNFDKDWMDIRGNGSYAVCLIAIDPMTSENGGIWVDRNSYPRNDKFEEDVHLIVLEPGDMLFMHPEILHWSEENRSNSSRRVLLTGFCVYGANHRNYPGDETNDVFVKNDEEIESQPAPWKEVGSTNF